MSDIGFMTSRCGPGPCRSTGGRSSPYASGCIDLVTAKWTYECAVVETIMIPVSYHMVMTSSVDASKFETVRVH